jgi:CHAT domain-containing protein
MDILRQHRWCILIAVVTACGGPSLRLDATSQSGPLVRQVSGHAPYPRLWVARFSAPTRGDTCSNGESVGSLRCGTPSSTAAISANLRASVVAAMNREPTADALHASALLDLISGDTAGISIARSISYLTMVARLEPSSAALTDLSAAYLIDASVRSDPRQLAASLEASTRALEIDDGSAPALFNRALAIDLLGLTGQATASWKKYLLVDQRSAFAREARNRIATLEEHPMRPAPVASSTVAEVVAFAKYSAIEARQFAWDVTFLEWAFATQRNDTAETRRQVEIASAVGQSLVSAFGDSSVDRATKAIVRTRANRANQRLLADAHIRYARAQHEGKRNNYAAADSDYRAILRNRGLSPTLDVRAQLGFANAQIYVGRSAEANKVMLAILASHDMISDPIPSARASWNSAMLALRANRYSEGSLFLERAQAAFARAGDTESVASAIGVSGEALFITGDERNGFTRVHQSLRLLARYPGSLWRHNALVVFAGAMTRGGWHRAASIAEEESYATAVRDGRTVSVIETTLARARAAVVRGDPNAAAQGIDSAARLVTRVPDSVARARLTQEISVSKATPILYSDPVKAGALLDSAIAFFAEHRLATKVIPAVILRAAAFAAAGDAEGALRSLARADSMYIDARVDLRRRALDQTIVRQARAVFDTLTLTYVRSHRPGIALRVVEARRAWASEQNRPFRGATARRNTVVTYAVAGHTLLTWAICGKDTTFIAPTVYGAATRKAIERARTLVDIDASDSLAKPALAILYDLFIRGIEPQLRTDRLMIVADVELLAVPFEGLWDERAGQYLIERTALAFSPTVNAAQHRGVPSKRIGVAVIGNPQLTARSFPALRSLAGATEEARLIARLYPGSEIVVGADADSANTMAAFARSSIVHFAGHAVLNDADPLQSYLAVEPRGITSAAIRSLILTHVNLVVLSACETTRGIEDDAGGFAGIAGAFLAAGAQGVVGSLRPISDSATVSLMTSFHNAYLKTGDAAFALRQAQLSAMGTSRSRTREWSAFRYVGA